jgi:hypothetical protein
MLSYHSVQTDTLLYMMFAPMNSSFFCRQYHQRLSLINNKQCCSVNAFKYNFPNRCIDARNS